MCLARSDSGIFAPSRALARRRSKSFGKGCGEEPFLQKRCSPRFALDILSRHREPRLSVAWRSHCRERKRGIRDCHVARTLVPRNDGRRGGFFWSLTLPSPRGRGFSYGRMFLESTVYARSHGGPWEREHRGVCSMRELSAAEVLHGLASSVLASRHSGGGLA